MIMLSHLVHVNIVIFINVTCDFFEMVLFIVMSNDYI